TAKSCRLSLLRTTAPCEPSPAPVPVPPVGNVPCGSSVPSAERSNATTAFPVGEFVSVYTAPGLFDAADAIAVAARTSAVASRLMPRTNVLIRNTVNLLAMSGRRRLLRSRVSCLRSARRVTRVLANSLRGAPRAPRAPRLGLQGRPRTRPAAPRADRPHRGAERNAALSGRAGADAARRARARSAGRARSRR